MKSFRNLIAEVAQPKAEDEINFKEKHIIDHSIDPEAEEDQFTADTIKKFKNKADYAVGDDIAVYEGNICLSRDVPGQEDDDVDNDEDQDVIDARLRHRRHAEIKGKIIDEGVDDLSEISIDLTRRYMNKAKAANRGFGFGFNGRDKTDAEIAKASKVGKRMFKVQDDIENADNSVRAKVHDLSHMDSDDDVYDHTQTSSRIKDGDVFKLSHGRAGVMVKAWPVITHGDSDALHKVSVGKHISTIDKGRYKKSHEVASKLATVNESMDPVGREDSDIDNDGKITNSDAYLHARRRAIAKKLKKEGLEPVTPAGGEYDSEKTHSAYKKSNKKQNTSQFETRTGLRIYAGDTKRSQIGESQSFFVEAYNQGILKLKDGSSVKLSKQDADLLNTMFNDLNSMNRKRMQGVLVADKNGFDEIIGFAREAL
jgi:hypothetical protein